VNDCPICTSSREAAVAAAISLGDDSAFDLVECRSCGTYFCDPPPTSAQLQRFYSAAYYDFDPHKERGKGMAFARRLTGFRRTGRFLDVGCATGFFIDGIRKNSDWTVSGIDFGESAVRYARDRLGLDVRSGELAESGFPDRSFDYIHVNNVLEHVRDPNLLLGTCRRLLKEDGRLHLSVPNGANDVLTLIAFSWEEGRPAFSHKGHIYFFPARALRRMIALAGFAIVTQRTYGIKRGLRNAGVLRRKRNWKANHQPRSLSCGGPDGDIAVSAGRKRSDFYYRWRFLSGCWTMVPGLNRYGLDYYFLLRPAGSPAPGANAWQKTSK
jgi:2-polyprenyl-3-methyl-5-hydroxy-6-metoxy-1,4-benzoquinol methylase